MKDSPRDRLEDGRTATDGLPADGAVPEDAEWRQVSQTRFEPSEPTGLTTTIVYAVADAEGVPPGDVKSPPLYDVVDTAALEAAFFGSDGDAGVDDPSNSTDFVYRDYRIVVRSDGWVLVHERLLE